MRVLFSAWYNSNGNLQHFGKSEWYCIHYTSNCTLASSTDSNSYAIFYDWSIDWREQFVKLKHVERIWFQGFCQQRNDDMLTAYTLQAFIALCECESVCYHKTIHVKWCDIFACLNTFTFKNLSSHRCTLYCPGFFVSQINVF